MLRLRHTRGPRLAGTDGFTGESSCIREAMLGICPGASFRRQLDRLPLLHRRIPRRIHFRRHSLEDSASDPADPSLVEAFGTGIVQRVLKEGEEETIGLKMMYQIDLSYHHKKRSFIMFDSW